MLDDLETYKDFFSKPSSEKAPLSVTELTLQIKGLLENSFGTIWVRGELSNFKYATSGHAYFSLKDENTVISAALFGWKKMLHTSERLRSIELKDGVEVLCRARLSVYAPRGSYQVTVDRIEVLGQGSLQAEFEKLKDKLFRKGLFEKSAKKALPLYPKKIAVITSSSAAALQDVLNVLNRRAPQIEVLVLPVLVQGATAAFEIIKALKWIEAQEDFCDLVLLTRGGGSQEDLWCFNDETLAHVLFDFKLPLISAVGHEIDFTIADFVADVRAPTPSAGAEILSMHWCEVAERLQEIHQKFHLLMTHQWQVSLNQFQNVFSQLISPQDRLFEYMQSCDEFLLRLEVAVRRKLEGGQSLFMQNVSKLNTLSPLRVLERGYTILQEEGDAENSGSTLAIIKSSEELRSGQKYTLQFYDGKRTIQAL